MRPVLRAGLHVAGELVQGDGAVLRAEVDLARDAVHGDGAVVRLHVQVGAGGHQDLVAHRPALVAVARSAGPVARMVPSVFTRMPLAISRAASVAAGLVCTRACTTMSRPSCDRTRHAAVLRAVDAQAAARRNAGLAHLAVRRRGRCCDGCGGTAPPTPRRSAGRRPSAPARRRQGRERRRSGTYASSAPVGIAKVGCPGGTAPPPVRKLRCAAAAKGLAAEAEGAEVRRSSGCGIRRGGAERPPPRPSPTRRQTAWGEGERTGREPTPERAP